MTLKNQQTLEKGAKQPSLFTHLYCPTTISGPFSQRMGVELNVKMLRVPGLTPSCITFPLTSHSRLTKQARTEGVPLSPLLC